MDSIWQQLPRPFYVLAPMEDVTDTVFRQVLLSCGRPHLFFTEFTNVEGLSSKGDAIVSQRLQFTQQEKPLIAQVWGKNPKNYLKAATRIKELGFDGIDINMGCPKKSEVQNGTCAALITNPSLASEIITATIEGAKGMPVSVKTRIGFHSIITEEWISFLLRHPIQALTVHGRTAIEQSLVPAHWDEIGKAVEIRNALGHKALIIGNGDIKTLLEAEEKVKTFHVDGVMIGRGIFHNPFLFNTNVSTNVTKEMLLEKAVDHLHLFNSTWKNKKPYQILKKYFKIYISGFPGASELREKLMETTSIEEALHILSSVQQ